MCLRCLCNLTNRCSSSRQSKQYSLLGIASDCERPCLGEEVSKLTSGAAAAAVVPFAPTAADIASMVDPAERFEVVVVATVFAVGPFPFGHGLGR